MSLVEARLEGRTFTVLLNRPDARNALSSGMCDGLTSILAAVPDAARVVVLRGAGPVFCAGADLAAVSGREADAFLAAFEVALEAISDLDLPTIAVLHGAALGGGFQLAGVCDFRIASDDARIGIPAAKLGIVVNLENVRRLVLLAGPGLAREILMLARTLTGAEAAARGIVTRSVTAADLDAAVEEMAGALSELAPLSVRGVKRAIRAVERELAPVRANDPSGAEEIDALVAAAYASRDLAEGLAAQAERRPPHFTG